MSVEWVLTDSKYEISSTDHLLQLMSKGTLFTDTGTPPDNYWSSDYVQVADVDLSSDSRITPIGTSSDPFSGSYDGSGFSVTDWSHQTTTDDDSGMFGYISSALVQNVFIEGSWVLGGVNNCGFLIGTMTSSSSVYNITGDFSAGSIASSGANVGGLIGSASGCTAEGLTLKGSLSSISGSANVGGVVGTMSSGSIINYCRNMVRFTEDLGFSAISGTSCAGVCAQVLSSSCTYLMNAMVGSIEGVEDAGGVFSTIENTSSDTITHVVNSMTGSVTSTGSSGGVSSSVQGDSSVFTMSTMVNYMAGSISGSLGSGGYSGSISDGVEVINSVIAMNGSVDYAGVQTSTGSNNSVEVQIITSFGLSHTNSGATTELTDLSGSFGMHSDFDALEYFALEGTDSVSNSYNWEFIFANVSGSPEYSQYTHIAISSGDVCAPVEIQLDLPDNSIEYVYFVDINANEVTASSGLSITYSSGVVLDTSGTTLYPVPPLVIVATSPFSLSLSWEEVTGSVIYRVSYGFASSGSLDKTVLTEGDETSLTITNLDSLGEYNFQLYSSSDGSDFTLEEDVEGSVTMPANSAEGYILSGFLSDDIYDFSGFSPDKSSQIASIVGNLLGQDESVMMKVNGETKELLVAGVTGSTIEVTDGDQYILPFQESDGSGQTLTLEGIYEGSLDYDETQNSLVIDGVDYFPGDSVIVGNTRITLKSV